MGSIIALKGTRKEKWITSPGEGVRRNWGYLKLIEDKNLSQRERNRNCRKYWPF